MKVIRCCDCGENMEVSQVGKGYTEELSRLPCSVCREEGTSTPEEKLLMAIFGYKEERKWDEEIGNG